MNVYIDCRKYSLYSFCGTPLLCLNEGCCVYVLEKLWLVLWMYYDRERIFAWEVVERD